MDLFGNGDIDLTTEEEATEFVVVPEGKYHVLCVDQQPDRARDDAGDKTGNVIWKLSLEILAGEHIGSHLRDTITFMNPKKPGLSEKEIKNAHTALSRVKHVLKRLGGIDVDAGKVNLNTVDLRGRQAIVDVRIEKFEKESTGEKREFNKIAFAGYSEPETPLPTDFVAGPRKELELAGAGVNGAARKPPKF